VEEGKSEGKGGKIFIVWLWAAKPYEKKKLKIKNFHCPALWLH
jgi:hypothetical protein